MNPRGEYRPIYTILADGPDFQRLTSDARLVVLIIKLSLGASGIDVLYPAVIEQRTGLRPGKVAKALAELAAAGWIRVDKNLIWLVRGLEFEPNMTPHNTNHRLAIKRRLDSLPRSVVVDEFRASYPDWTTNSHGNLDPHSDPHRDPHSDGSEIPSRSPSGSLKQKLVTNTEPATATATTRSTTPHSANGAEREVPAALVAAELPPPPRRRRQPDPPADPGSWPAQATEILASHVGAFTIGRVGKALKPVVDRVGWPWAEFALRKFGRDYDHVLGPRPPTPEAFASRFVEFLPLERPLWDGPTKLLGPTPDMVP